MKFIFRGFLTRGTGLIAAHVSLNEVIYTVPLTLKPGEEPTEEWILKELADGIKKVDSFREAFQPFEDKYRNRVIQLGDTLDDLC